MEEKYQPLVEVETVNGDVVKIPAIWQDSWESLKEGRSQQVLVDTLKDIIGTRGYQAADFARVLLGIYQPKKSDTQ